jgi:DNA-binding NarL/FixJ family response regulator
LQATGLGREVFSHLGFPISATDTIIRQLQESHAEVVIVEVLLQSAERAIRAIELIRATTQIAIFVSGDTTRPANTVASMRNDASGYFDCSAGDEALLEALARFSASRTLKSTYWDVRKWN